MNAREEGSRKEDPFTGAPAEVPWKRKATEWSRMP
jgi:hypothetical protein